MPGGPLGFMRLIRVGILHLLRGSTLTLGPSRFHCPNVMKISLFYSPPFFLYLNPFSFSPPLIIIHRIPFVCFPSHFFFIFLFLFSFFIFSFLFLTLLPEWIKKWGKLPTTFLLCHLSSSHFFLIFLIFFFSFYFPLLTHGSM